MTKKDKKIKGPESVNDLILQRVRLRCKRRIAWLRKIWKEAMASEGDRAFDNHMEVDGSLQVVDRPHEEEHWYMSEPSLQEVTEEIKAVEKLISLDKASRYRKLVSIFALNDLEQNILQTCLALYLEPGLSAAYAYLQDHAQRGYVSRHLCAKLFQQPETLALGSSSPLLSWEIVTENDNGKSEPARIEGDSFLRKWLLGSDDIDGSISDFVSVKNLVKPLAHWPVDETVRELRDLMLRKINLRVMITGEEGSGKSSFAAAVAERLAMRLLVVEGKDIPASLWPGVFIKIQRQAWLENLAVMWKGIASVVNAWPAVTPFPLQFTSGNTSASLPQDPRFYDVHVAMPVIPQDDVSSLWQSFVPGFSSWTAVDQKIATGKYITIGALATLAKSHVENAEDASEKLRSLTRKKLGNLAQLFNASFSPDDLILPQHVKNALNDFYYEAMERNSVLQDPAIRKYFPQGTGLIAMFTGAPGTGKTMAAQVIANSLQLDLFRIDLSAVISKYIGETSKNIEQILTQAENMNAVLLFDEADSLFGKRTEIRDAHDRYANTDTNYLLQAIEQYNGIAILSSNKKENVDHGFRRRLRYAIEFPKPDARQRLMLWTRLISELKGEENLMPLVEDLEKLSAMIEVTGAQIKQAILSAIFMARQEGRQLVSMKHLVKGVERELMKENRNIGQQVLELLKKDTVE